MNTTPMPEDERERKGEEGIAAALAPAEPPKTPAAYTYADSVLPTIGYYDAGYKRRKPTEAEPSKSLTLPDGRRFEIVPSQKYGYPNTEDLDFQRGFEQIVAARLERRADHSAAGEQVRRPHLAVPIAFSTRELLKAAGRTESGRDWRAAHAWVKRQTATTVEGAFKLGKEGTLQQLTTHLFNESYLVGEPMKNGTAADQIYVVPAGWYLSQLAYLRVQLLDTTLHQRLGRFSYAKNLLPILTAGWYAAGGSPYRKSYRAVVEMFGMPFQKYPSDRQRWLDPGHQRLRALRVLKAWTWEHRKEDSVLTFHPGPKYFEDQDVRQGRRAIAEQISTPKRRGRPPRADRGAGDTITPPPAGSPADSPLEAAQRADFKAAYSKVLVDDVLAYTGDSKSEPFYRQIVAELVAAGRDRLVYQALSETKAADVPPGTVRNRGAYFTDRLLALKAQLELPLEETAATTAGRSEQSEDRPPHIERREDQEVPPAG